MYNVVQNPIPKSKLFVTPVDEQDLFERIESMPKRERAIAYQIAMMTFNLSNKLVEEKILSKEVFAS